MHTAGKAAGIANVLLLLVSGAVAAQSIEAGATIGNGQRGSEGAVVVTEARLVTGVQVGVLWADRIETVFRSAWLDLPSTPRGATYYYGCEPGADGGCRPAGSLRVIRQATSARWFPSGQVLYHFRRGRQVRPFAGLAVGTMRDTEARVCEVTGCEQLIPGLQSVLGSSTNWNSDPLHPVAGVSSRFGEHLTIRGGIDFHRPFGEELSLFETFVGVGYRF